MYTFTHTLYRIKNINTGKYISGGTKYRTSKSGKFYSLSNLKRHLQLVLSQRISGYPEKTYRIEEVQIVITDKKITISDII